MSISQIIYNTETDCYELDGDSLHGGDRLEVLIHNGLSNEDEWIETSIEHNQDGWYLTGLVGFQIPGLFARKFK